MAYQSSEGLGVSHAKLLCHCMQVLPKAFAFRVPLLNVVLAKVLSLGGINLSCPTGGSAKGIPRKLPAPELSHLTPSIFPDGTVTTTASALVRDPSVTAAQTSGTANAKFGRISVVRQARARSSSESSTKVR